MRFSAIGDVAMTIPVVYEVCRANPDVRFVYVSRPSMTTMMVNRPENLTLHPADVSGSYKGVRGMRRLYRELRDAYGFDALADLHSVLRTSVVSLFARLGGARVARLDKDRRGRRRLTRNSGDKALCQMRPMVMRYADVFARLGLNPGGRFTSLWGPQGAPDEAYAAITGPKPDGERWMAVAPFAKHPGKIYPPEKTRAVVEALIAAHPDLRIFLFGGGDSEKQTLSRWAQEIERVTSLAGERYGFPAELALMSKLDAALTMDSANMHLCSLVGVPVVSVWGATHPYAGFRGYGQRADLAVQLAMSCRPCSIFGNKPCVRGDYHCLAGIPPRAIIERVNTILEK